jgi:hypothetical protein
MNFADLIMTVIHLVGHEGLRTVGLINRDDDVPVQGLMQTSHMSVISNECLKHTARLWTSAICPVDILFRCASATLQFVIVYLLHCNLEHRYFFTRY